MTAKNVCVAALLLLGLGSSVRADDQLPSGAFDASRYQALWDKSPFAVATPVAVESAEYALVGIAQLDGVSYASIVDRQNSNHFVVTSTTPAHGISLVSLVRGQNADSTYATLQNGPTVLRLKLETSAPAGLTPPPQQAQIAAPPVIGTSVATPAFTPGFHRRPPHARNFTTPIFVPRPPPNSP